jgi:hypothetical protein
MAASTSTVWALFVNLPAGNRRPLLSATADLDDENLEEVTLYAQFRRARQRKKTR